MAHRVAEGVLSLDHDRQDHSPSLREGPGPLNALGLGTGDTLRTEKHTFIAPFVNAERPEYLVIEDSFPNGRPPLELAGAYSPTGRRWTGWNG